MATFGDASSSLVLRVAGVAGSPLAEVQTSASLGDARARTEVYFHASTVIAYAWHPALGGKLVLLSPDRRRVVATRALTGPDYAWDDGLRVHIESGANDITLDDALHTIQSGPSRTPPQPAGSIAPTDVDGLGGSGVTYEFDLAANHFWLTSGCCGDRGGLFVAQVR